MKRIFYILIAMMAVSCNTSEQLDHIAPSDELSDDVRFSTWVAHTRASEADNGVVQDSGFWVSAYLDRTEYGFQHYFDGKVTYAGGWTCDNPQLWTSSGSMTFDAYSYDKNITLEEDALVQSGRTLDYTCSPDIDQQIDLLAISTDVENKKLAQLKFEHALSQINFSVDFSGTAETHVTLDRINIYYHNIKSQGTYIFGSDGDANGTTSGKGTWTLGTATFGASGYASTAISPNLTEKVSDGDDMIFESTNSLMIIPQPVNIVDGGNYLSVSVEYTLGAGMSAGTSVATGKMELPAPGLTADAYLMGKAYTYNIMVNGEQISLGLSIDDAEKPLYAYGNIDLDLITTPITKSEYEAALATRADDEPTYYYTTAKRVAELLGDADDPVRDFVVVGSFGADAVGKHHGILGYSGSESSPFFIAANDLGMMPAWRDSTDAKGNNHKIFTAPPLAQNLFSVDLRGVYKFPTFESQHPGESTDPELNKAPTLPDGIFRDLALLDEVTLPHGLKAIGDFSFQNCISLESVDLPDVKHIGAGGFVDCTKLVTVKGDNIVRVHDYGFDDCVLLRNINLANVVQVDQYGFVDCKSLTNVNFTLLDVVGAHAFSGCESLTLDEDSEIPQLDHVAEYAFKGCKMLCAHDDPKQHKLDLTQTSSVGEFAFNGCTKLVVNDGDLRKMKYIGKFAFMDCQYLGSAHTMELPLIDTIGVSSFQNCARLNITKGLSNLREIPVSAFQGCTSLTGFAAPETTLRLPNVSLVDTLAFSGSGLTSVLFDNQPLTIRAHAFDGCTSLTSITGLGGVTTLEDFGFSGAVFGGDLVMNNLEEIGSYAFSSCCNLTSLTANNVTKVGVDFISGCSSLTKLILPAVATDKLSDEKSVSKTLYEMRHTLREVDVADLPIESASWNDWGENTTLQSLNIASAKAIADFGFYSYKALETLIATGAQSVGANAFQHCSSLKVVDLPNARTLGGAAFDGCTSLEVLRIPLIEAPIADWSFSNFKALRIVDASKATAIGPGAFANCTALESIDLSGFEGTPAEYVDSWNYPFSGASTATCTLYLSQAQKDAHAVGNVWYGATWGSIEVR